ncbi:uncharacterized protein M421DRAFT_422941 [Didymella exigua CBS 183.55]|uniref:Uncharacterized protein n=1 Tax=Didymella exigua CBS 183.55 TaxID=1150837 RepID=A0A6A5RGH3_9PLEO|nr:uncharacterized protein M421DRAFT_422941 [Didymella exigua CBS 183.55]KAF1926258.1 hypothetical protein M421DRAFT_422941 [Didymella exigua CBS 183.55]
MAWSIHYYREIYAAALVEAGNTDAKFDEFCDVSGRSLRDILPRPVEDGKYSGNGREDVAGFEQAGKL